MTESAGCPPRKRLLRRMPKHESEGQKLRHTSVSFSPGKGYRRPYNFDGLQAT